MYVHAVVFNIFKAYYLSLLFNVEDLIALYGLLQCLVTTLEHVDSFLRRTVDLYAFAGAVHFPKMLSVTLIFEPVILKICQCRVDVVMSNLVKFH